MAHSTARDAGDIYKMQVDGLVGNAYEQCFPLVVGPLEGPDGVGMDG